jgi:hypothetical protein
MMSPQTQNHAASISMASQRQRFGPHKSTAPEKLSFVLPGRRTLSEHLPAEVINVPITVAQRSRCLRKAMVQQALNDPTRRQIRLPDVDSMGFRIYVEWLQSGQVELHAPTSSGSSGGLLLRDSFDLIFAHIAGSQLEEPDFQDYIIDTSTKLLDSSQTPDLKVLEVVFLERGASNILKQFVVDRMFAIERKMLAMMRGSIDDLGNPVGCEYHVHEAGACYKNKIKEEPANEDNSANKRQKFYNWVTSSLHTSSQRAECPSATYPQICTLADTTLYSMTEENYRASAEWSREVHGSKQRARTPNVCTNKPLPTIPPLTPGTSQSPLSSPDSLHFPGLSNAESNVMGTQDIVQECLERLQRTDVSSARTGHSADAHDPDISVLVLECLERFKKTSTEDASASSPEGSPWSERVSPDYLYSLRNQEQEQEQEFTSPYLHNPDSSPSPHQGTWERSSGSFSKPPLLQSQAEPRSTPETYPLQQDSSQSFPIVPTRTSTLSRKSIPLHSDSPQLIPVSPSRTSTINRKAAPLRGEDWLQQYNTINAMMNNTSFMMAKQSKKSRFKELLRIDSISNRYELEGSVLVARHDSQTL